MSEFDAILNVVDKIGKLGYPATLLLIIYLGSRGVWVFGWQARAQAAMYDKLLEDSKEREDGWRDLALTGRELAHTGKQIARQAVDENRR